MMPSVLKICSDLNNLVVYSRLKRESSEAVALVECDEREVIHIDRHKYPLFTASAPACVSLTHERDFSTIFNNFQTLLAARIYKPSNLFG